MYQNLYSYLVEAIRTGLRQQFSLEIIVIIDLSKSFILAPHIYGVPYRMYDNC